MTTTLALFCGTSSKVIEQLMKNANHDGLVIACKAAKLTWPTFVAVLKARFVNHTVSDYELEIAREIPSWRCRRRRRKEQFGL